MSPFRPGLVPQIVPQPGAAGAAGPAPAGTGLVQVVAGVLTNPATLGAPRSVLRVNDAGTALEEWDPERVLKVTTFYPYDVASDVGDYFNLSSVAVTTPEDADAIVTGAGAAPVTAMGDSYVSLSAGLGSAVIPAGLWEWVVWASVDSVAGSTTLLDLLVYTRTAAGVETLIATLSTTALTATVARYVAQATLGADTVINATDRLVVKAQARRTVGAAARTVTWYHGGSARFSYLMTPVVEAVAVAREELDATRRSAYVPPTNAAPWAFAAGAGAAAVVGSVLRFTLPAFTAGDWYSGQVTAPRAVLTHGMSGWDLDVAVRIDAATLEQAARLSGLQLTVESASQAFCPGIRVYDGGAVKIGYTTAAGWNETLASTLVCDMAGNGWVRLRVDGALLSWYVGTGANDNRPTTWSLVRAIAFGMEAIDDLEPPLTVVAALVANGAQTIQMVLDLGAVQVDDLREVE